VGRLEDARVLAAPVVFLVVLVTLLVEATTMPLLVRRTHVWRRAD
jgi:NhaP-type Na+/H+ or K+/H+ antiporter